MKRAAFEMSCPENELDITVLRDSDPDPVSRGMAGATVGVSGCGKKAVYLFVDGAGWTLDSASKSAAASK